MKTKNTFYLKGEIGNRADQANLAQKFFAPEKETKSNRSTGQPTPEPLPILKKEKTIYSWQALEFEKKIYSKNKTLTIFGLMFFFALYGFLTDNLFMSIIFILSGIIFYYLKNKKPEKCLFAITTEGIFAQDQLYEFSSLSSFWLFGNEKGEKKELSLKSKKAFMPYIKIPLGDADTNQIRQSLKKFLPERKHEIGLSDFVDKQI